MITGKDMNHSATPWSVTIPTRGDDRRNRERVRLPQSHPYFLVKGTGKVEMLDRLMARHPLVRGSNKVRLLLNGTGEYSRKILSQC